MAHDNSIKTFGYGYLVGDAALMTAGILKAREDAQKQGVSVTQTQRFKETIAGGIYATAGVIGAHWGNPSTEKKLELLYGEMQKDLTRMGVQIPADATPELLARDGGLIDHIDRFLYRHPTQMIHAIFAAGGIPNMIAGLPKNGSAFNASTFASGLLITIGGLVGLLLPEKKPDPAHPAEGFGAKLLEKAQANPLATAAAIFTTNNAFLLTGAMQDKKEFAGSTTGAQNAWLFKLVTAAAYITSNYFLSQSRRDNTGAKGGEHDAVIAALRSTSARLVLAQPAPMQDEVLHHVAGYLASRPEVGMKADELALQMKQEMAQIANQQHAAPSTADANSWVARSGQTAAVETPQR